MDPAAFQGIIVMSLLMSLWLSVLAAVSIAALLRDSRVQRLYAMPPPRIVRDTREAPSVPLTRRPLVRRDLGSSSPVTLRITPESEMLTQPSVNREMQSILKAHAARSAHLSDTQEGRAVS